MVNIWNKNKWADALKRVTEDHTIHQVLPLVIALLVTVYVHLFTQQLSSWRSFFLTFTQVSVELSPIIICKYLAVKSTGKGRLGWWLIGFIVLPLLVFISANNNPVFLDWLISNDLTFITLATIELLSLMNNWYFESRTSRSKVTLSLDNVILAILIVVSFIWGLLLNSNEDPLRNQPIPILIDLKRNFENILSLLWYTLQIMVIYGCLYLVYLVNHHVLIKRVLSQKGLFTYLWSTTLFLLLFYPILAQLVLWLPMNQVPSPLNASSNHNPFDFWNIYIGAVVVAFSTPLIMAFKLQNDHRQMAELQKEKLQTELKWLQQQVNPHFLFNTLNNLYSLTLSKSTSAPDAILQLADLLRFVVYKGSEKLVSLQDEINYLNDYLSLQQLRVANKCQFDVTITQEEVGELLVSPLLIVNFIENAIKHGVEPSDKNAWLKVNLQLDGQTLKFVCENSVSGYVAREKNDKGIGLKNVNRRLELMYPNKHVLVKESTPDFYKIQLSLELTPVDSLRGER